MQYLGKKVAVHAFALVSLGLVSCARTETVCIETKAVTFEVIPGETREIDRTDCAEGDPPQICDDGVCVCASQDTTCRAILAARAEEARRRAEEERLARCCRVCTEGKACGDACIQASDTCRTTGGCACNG